MNVPSKLEGTSLRSFLAWSSLIRGLLKRKLTFERTLFLTIILSLFSTRKVWVRLLSKYISGTKRAASLAGPNAPLGRAKIHRKDSLRKAEVNKQFIFSLLKICQILIPSAKSKIIWILILHTFFLVLRTYISLYIATLDGKLAKYLVSLESKDAYRLFLKRN
jgi:ATP-binding cassette, subfamily D (ALD), peroxisomal long-chain fatty acid import protein